MYGIDTHIQDTIDMVRRKEAVDPAIKAWDEKMKAIWEKKDEQWKIDYDQQIADEERELREEEERWNSLNEEEKEEERKKICDEFMLSDYENESENESEKENEKDVNDIEDDSDFYVSDDDEEEVELTPEQKKEKEWLQYQEEQKTYRAKRRNEIWNRMLYCSWSELLKYRTELGLSNEQYEESTYHMNRKTNQLY